MAAEADQPGARACEVMFEEVDEGKTRVVVIFDAEDQNPVEAQQAGWQSILDNFKKLVESEHS